MLIKPIYTKKEWINYLAYKFNQYKSTVLLKDRYIQIEKSVDYVLLQGGSLNDVYTCFHLGIKNIENRLYRMSLTLSNLQDNSPNYFNNERYHAVINNELPTFLKEYDYLYNATDYLFDYDYPLLDGIALYHEMYNLQGLDFVEEYVHRLLLEQQIITFYDPNQVRNLVNQLENKMKISVYYLGLNLVETVLTQHLYLLSMGIVNTLFSTERYDFDLESGWTKLTSLFPQEIQTYLSERSMYLKDKIFAIIEKGNIHALYIPENIQDFTGNVSLHEKLTDIQFNKIINNIISIESLPDKIDIFLSNAYHPEDFFDLVAQLFFEEEVMSVFNRLDSYSLAIILMYLDPFMHAFNQKIKLNSIFWDTYKEVPYYLPIRKASMIQKNKITTIINSYTIKNQI